MPEFLREWLQSLTPAQAAQLADYISDNEDVPVEMMDEILPSLA